MGSRILALEVVARDTGTHYEKTLIADRNNLTHEKMKIMIYIK